MTDRPEIAITLDVDWAPEAAIVHTADILQAHGLRATYFATHRSAALMSLEQAGFEIALHPNFNDLPSSFDAPIAELKAIYGAAAGARSHSLFVSSHVLVAYTGNGLRYESNIFLDGHDHLHPVMRFASLLSIPFNWSDDKHLELGRPLVGADFGLQRPGLRVFNFHPIHVYMNTRDDSHYQQFRELIQSPGELEPFRGQGAGIGTVFAELAGQLAAGGLRAATMLEICDEWAAHGD